MTASCKVRTRTRDFCVSRHYFYSEYSGKYVTSGDVSNVKFLPRLKRRALTSDPVSLRPFLRGLHEGHVPYRRLLCVGSRQVSSGSQLRCLSCCGHTSRKAADQWVPERRSRPAAATEVSPQKPGCVEGVCLGSCLVLFLLF